MRSFFHPILLALLIGTVLPACGSVGDDGALVEGDWVQGHEHGFDYYFDESVEVLKARYDLEVVDREKKEITTVWDTQLAYFSEQGTRSKLTVSFREDPKLGWIISTKEVQEMNTNQVAPTMIEAAEWEATESDGSLTSFYRLGMTARMRPHNKWRRDRDERLEKIQENAESGAPSNQ